jgi:hypothetical protein
MAGAYAHLTLVNLARDTRRLEAAGMPFGAIKAVGKYLAACELGSVSPDYPYLHFSSRVSKRWADLMHWKRTGEPIRHGVSLLRAMEGEAKSKALAWLLGYAAHVIADVTIHPVVELRVGPYAENALAHRVCELNQDAYIFRRLNLDEIGVSEHLDSGIGACCGTPGSGRLDAVIAQFWRAVLNHSHPAQYLLDKPDLDSWHTGFKFALDAAEEGHHLPKFARHVAVDCGLTYPPFGNVDHSYTRNLQTPDGAMDYDAVFDKALGNIVDIWTVIGKGVYDADSAYLSAIGDWDLDTGKDASGKYAFWSAPAAATQQ